MSCHYGFSNYFELVNFAFSNVIPEAFYPLKYYPFSINTSRNMKFWKSCKFTLNPHFQSSQSDLANFEERFLLISTYKMCWNLYVVTNWQILIKFWDGSWPSLKSFAQFGSNECVGPCSEKKKKCYNFLATMPNGKKRSYNDPRPK